MTQRKSINSSSTISFYAVVASLSCNYLSATKRHISPPIPPRTHSSAFRWKNRLYFSSALVRPLLLLYESQAGRRIASRGGQFLRARLDTEGYLRDDYRPSFCTGRTLHSAHCELSLNLQSRARASKKVGVSCVYATKQILAIPEAETTRPCDVVMELGWAAVGTGKN